MSCAHSSQLYYTDCINNIKNLLHRATRSTMPSLFKNYLPAEVRYLQIRFNKTNSFPGNTKKTDRNGVNQHNKHRETILERVAKDENISYSLF